MEQIRIGDKVKVCLPPETPTADGKSMELVRKYDGQTFKVANKVPIRNRRTVYGSYYELVGAVSQYGKPYGFLDDWLMPVRRRR